MERETKVALLMAASLFMEILDGTIVTVAIPRIGFSLSQSTATTSLLISVYLMTVAIFIPLSGWLAGRIGDKKIWLGAVALFTISSLGSALSPSFTVLLLMRILQGFSGSLMTPTARLIVLEKTIPSKLLKMISYLVWPALIAPALAPLLGGILVTYWSWRWIFLINLPIGIVIFILGFHMLSNNRLEHKVPFDVVGFLEMALSSSLIILGADLATHLNVKWWMSISVFGSGLALFSVTFFHIVNCKNPIFKLSALKIPSFRISQTGGSILWLSVGALPYLLTAYLQLILKWSALQAGEMVFFIFIGNIGMKPFTNKIILRLRYKNTLLTALIAIMTSGILFAFVRPNTSVVLIAGLTTISGMGRSLALTAYNGLSFTEVLFKDRSSANTLNSITQTLAQALGISLITVLVHLLSIEMLLSSAYQYGFLFLGSILIIPIIEIVILPSSLGESSLGGQI